MSTGPVSRSAAAVMLNSVSAASCSAVTSLLLRGEELVLLDQHVEHSAGARQRLLPKAGQRDLSTVEPSRVGPIRSG
jgi:hypothetical protein